MVVQAFWLNLRDSIDRNYLRATTYSLNLGWLTSFIIDAMS